MLCLQLRNLQSRRTRLTLTSKGPFRAIYGRGSRELTAQEGSERVKLTACLGWVSPSWKEAPGSRRENLKLRATLGPPRQQRKRDTLSGGRRQREEARNKLKELLGWRAGTWEQQIKAIHPFTYLSILP